MRSTSCETAAREVLRQCVAGSPPAELPPTLREDHCAQALFGILIEGLGDRFEPALCDAYARLLSPAIPGADLERYKRVRLPHRVAAEPARVLVLSRVTLGADVAVTSVILAAAKEAFPKAEIVFAGPHKNFEMFAADPRLTHAPVEYLRGSLPQRLAVRDELSRLAAAPDCLVLDPDSRLTQLGLLPICDENRYHLFESRRYGRDTEFNLPTLAARWSNETLGVPNAVPYIAPVGEISRQSGAPYIAVSLGVGENPAKRISDAFERQLLALLGARAPLVIDKGAGGDEAARVERAAARSGAQATFWEGSFAGFARIIAGASLYVGYDSAGQHVAAACGVPLVSIFAGFPTPRMFQRWRPSGSRVTVIRVDHPDPAGILARVADALK